MFFKSRNPVTVPKDDTVDTDDELQRLSRLAWDNNMRVDKIILSETAFRQIRSECTYFKTMKGNGNWVYMSTPVEVVPDFQIKVSKRLIKNSKKEK